MQESDPILDVLRHLDELLTSIALGRGPGETLDQLGRALVEDLGFATAVGHLALDDDAVALWEERLAAAVPVAATTVCRSGPQWLAPLRTAEDNRLLGTVVLTAAPEPGTETEPGTGAELDPRRAELVQIVVRQVGYALEAAYRGSRDPLTGLLNWSGVYRRIEQLLASPRDPARPGAVMFCDLNGYKLVNDRFGHLVGDDVLATVAARIAGIVRQTDTVGRYGGDEFVLVLPGIGRTQAEETAARVLRAVHEPIPVDGGSCQVGASVGVVVVDTLTNARDLLDRADQAMYDAKRDRAGAGQVTYSMTTDLSGFPEPAPS